MFRSIVFGLLAAGLALLSAAPASADSAVLGQEYGSGVHAYFAGDYVAAYDALTAAINGGSKDPRAYYFRGLVYLKLGRAPEAAMDFRKGAELESKDTNQFYDVGRALERVQGEPRLELERYRVKARMAALEEAEKIRKARYEAIQREEARVLREQALAAPEKPIEPAETQPGEAENPFAVPKQENPFAAPEKKPAAKSEKKPADKSAGEENPFGEEPKDKPAEKKPAEKKPAEKKPAEKKPVEKKSTPDDPFADQPSEKKPAEKPAEPKNTEKKKGILGAIGGALGKSLGGEKKGEKKPDAEKKPAEKNDSPDDPFGSS